MLMLSESLEIPPQPPQTKKELKCKYLSEKFAFKVLNYQKLIQIHFYKYVAMHVFHA